MNQVTEIEKQRDKETDDSFTSQSYISFKTKNSLSVMTRLLSITLTFVSFYFGATFILVSMTIITLQQL